MKPAAFDYVRVTNKREALQQLSEYGEQARIIAGGQSLMAVLNMRLAQPKILIDINQASDLHYLKLENNHLKIGAAVRQVELLDRASLADEVPLLAQAMPWIGHFQTRNRGTVCGSVAHADPSAEIPLCLVTLGGTVVLESLKGKRREVVAAEFFQGVLTTEKRPDEMVVEVQFPLRETGVIYRFREIAMRHGDFALVALAACIRQREADLGIGGVADRPTLHRLPLGAELKDSLNTLAWSLGAQDDVHASAPYRRQLVRELGQQLIEGNDHARAS
ncbi:FAD binding domain-containing protein [Halomonas dongshanensis]|uniref:FAD binding domain-containing protein n=1 Tax=Halomonas dongshanensis TaxID=2890835 RepID=A0ABT2E8B7_9GAMM|nr:FAD binding domain-containing protein [Halomonas dongshanensis]MCS2607806.1 FAD binding domain-containing protein [Halomonas dongshanensis]